MGLCSKPSNSHTHTHTRTPTAMHRAGSHLASGCKHFNSFAYPSQFAVRFAQFWRSVSGSAVYGSTSGFTPSSVGTHLVRLDLQQHKTSCTTTLSLSRWTMSAAFGACRSVSGWMSLSDGAQQQFYGFYLVGGHFSLPTVGQTHYRVLCGCVCVYGCYS